MARDRYLPPSGTKAQRRREQQEDEADRLAHERPNVPPRPGPDPHYTDCPDSKYRTHRFDAHGRDGVWRCSFCGRAFQDCLREA